MTDAPVEKTAPAQHITWDLTDLYAGVDDPALAADMTKAEKQAEAYAEKYRGRIGSLSAAELVQSLEEMAELEELDARLGTFAYLMYSTDTGDPQRGALVQKYQEFTARLGQTLVFATLEWNDAPEDHVKKVLADPALDRYHHYLESARRYKPYQLSEPEEKLVMEKNVNGRNAWTRFFTQLTSAMRYDYEGEKLTQTEILNKLHNPDRDVRQKAARAVTDGLREKGMELTYIFNVLAADKASDDRLRGYPTWVSSRNLSNKAPDEVVEALITSVTANYDIVARHYKLKGAVLGLDELTDYDRYAPLPARDSDKVYAWDEARDIVLNAFRNFSPKMADGTALFFENGWIDAALAPNKRGGAFATSVTPSLHPYVFLNYEGRARDVATLAHELGHGIHMYLAGRQQTIFDFVTPLTTAEMASTFAEMLVFTDLMEREDDAEARLSMLSGKIEDTFATVFRQISMNRFEDGMHTARRDEGELTTERLSEIWLETQRAMFGDSVAMTDDYGIWWSYVPHFLQTPGYVYAYAFGELLVLALFRLYQERGADFVPQYEDVLSAGGSDYPDRILAKVGVDLNDPAFWNKGLDAIRDLVAQEEALAKEVYPDRF
jgi:oligoendopeptidase F